MKRNVSIADYLKPLDSAPTQCYLTNTLQVADVVEWVLSQLGKSTIWQSSFSISEEFLRRLYFIEKSGRVDTIHLILDFKATQKTLRLWPFLTRVIEHTYLADNHSKVILIRALASTPAEAAPEQTPAEQLPPDASLLPSATASAAPPPPRCVAIITSQNLTRGNRNESALVTTSPEVFTTFLTSLEDIMRNHSVPLSELFAQKLAE